MYANARTVKPRRPTKHRQRILPIYACAARARPQLLFDSTRPQASPSFASFSSLEAVRYPQVPIGSLVQLQRFLYFVYAVQDTQKLCVSWRERLYTEAYSEAIAGTGNSTQWQFLGKIVYKPQYLKTKLFWPRT